MFSSRQRQIERQGKYGTPRGDYLEKLVTEFQHTNSQEAKREILANLANFGYDPINFDDFIRLNIAELFIDCLDEPDSALRDLGLAGLTNIVPDSRFCKVVVEVDAVQPIIKFLSSTNVENVLNAMSTLLFLAENNSTAHQRIATKAVIDAMVRYSSANNVRLKNMSTILLQHLRGGAVAKSQPQQPPASALSQVQLPKLSPADLGAMNNKPLYGKG